LLPLSRALWQAHYPDGWGGYNAARYRLAFEELFLIQLGVLSHKRTADFGVHGPQLEPPPGVMDAFLGALPFKLTDAQHLVLGEVLRDMAGSGRPMSRLLQGEVGSGKTVVALAALLVAATCSYQGAIMAPTEVLAEQHFLTVRRLLAGLARPRAKEYLVSVDLDPFPRPITIGLLLGNMTAARKREVHGLLAEGALDVVIGTHALVQEQVSIPRLGLAIADEQHRFGVAQRAALRQRGTAAVSPHLLVMSATPIPRTLALTLYGDLDLSTINELPPGRGKVRTKRVNPAQRTAVYDFVRKEVTAGRQAFVIYPLIDESEAINARAAVKERDRLATEVFPDLAVGLLHGRMNMREKQGSMEDFRLGQLDILVSTPVVEVGIDVPNATVMLIEGADRFGLSQLHQFRGRVGRGEHASYCILVAESPSDEAVERLSAMERIDDGFELAEVDLRLRGPGDYFGTRQSGLPDLRMARLTDTELLTLARTEAEALLERDPELAAPAHTALKDALARFTTPVGGEVG
jgi:ATP-dependent DNA helicase RecG